MRWKDNIIIDVTEIGVNVEIVIDSARENAIKGALINYVKDDFSNF